MYLHLLRSWIDQYLLGGVAAGDTDDVISVAEVAVGAIVVELSPNVLVSTAGILPSGFVDLSSAIPVNVIENKDIIFGYNTHIK